MCKVGHQALSYVKVLSETHDIKVYIRLIATASERNFEHEE